MSAQPTVWGQPRRPRRGLAGRIALTAGLAVVLAVVSLSLVLALPKAGARVLGPPASMCVGEAAWMSARSSGGARALVRVKTQGPDGSVVLKAKKKVSKKWTKWSFTPTKPGLYLTTYRSTPRRWKFTTKVTECGPSGPTTPGTPTPGTPTQPPPGTVSIDDDDAASALFSMPSMAPGDSQTSCMTVTYQGSLPSTVRMYGVTSGTGLADHLQVSVTRGTSTSPFGSCATFQPDPLDYLGQGTGVVFSGSLAGLPDDYLLGLTDPALGVPEVWTSGETHAYRLTVSLPAGAAEASQGLTASQTFIWEARD